MLESSKDVGERNYNGGHDGPSSPQNNVYDVQHGEYNVERDHAESALSPMDDQYHSPFESDRISAQNNYLDDDDDNEPLNSEEALLDLVQLEELQSEAERMKAVGNKHMASQEYMQAYNAYSAALQLSPVGPSSHVFLSNRAAALLSLKKYPAAATDSRRAIALAPTFGKAHARLGQALYFLKDFQGAVQAYQDAIEFEPDNEVTMTYLQKAKAKLEKQQQKKLRYQQKGGSIAGSHYGEEASSAAESTHFSAHNSIATDPNATFGVVQPGQYRGLANNNSAVMKNVAGSMSVLPKTHEQLQQRASHPHIGVPSSAVSVAASAITMESEENQKQQIRSSIQSNNISQMNEISLAIDDPEFEEALQIQQRANKFLVQKQYRAAIEEYTAALFLIPDDPILSPDLHLGRAHALNGSRRHESAKNDAMLAVKLNPTPAAYSTLAKSLFYLKDYAGSVDAFEKCIQLLPPGESLGVFDRAYLEKAEKALAELESEGRLISPQKQQQPVPKLPPPRFVPREDALQSQPQSLRPMPKEWPQQPAMKSTPLKCGAEREVVFLSEALGVKLNRGCDGIVRVLSVTPITAGSVVARQGDIQAGDVVREAAGVDIRRPITNIMWGDTVALIKMAPRPISFLVAKELSPVPLAVLEEQRKREQEQQQQQQRLTPNPQRQQRPLVRPSNANGDEPVASVESPRIGDSELLTDTDDSENDVEDDIMEIKDFITHDIVEIENNESMTIEARDTKSICIPQSPAITSSSQLKLENELNVDDNAPASGSNLQSECTETSAADKSNEKPDENVDLSSLNSLKVDKDELEDEDIVEVEDARTNASVAMPLQDPQTLDASDPSDAYPNSEENIVGGEILFLRGERPSYGAWDALRWMSYSGSRQVSFCQQVYRQFEIDTKRNLLHSFWRTGGKQYESRALAFYEHPTLIVVLRRPLNLEELYNVLDLEDASLIGDNAKVLEKYWILESAVDPSTAKLRLSSLTSLTSVAEENADDRDRSCFEIISPTENISLSAVRTGANRGEPSFRDNSAYLDTSAVEKLLANKICSAHFNSHENTLPILDISWKHQIVIGSLHSIVLSGNIKALNMAMEYAKKNFVGEKEEGQSKNVTPSRVLDAKDEAGFTPLYYACKNKMHAVAQSLVNEGANVISRQEPGDVSLLHVAARNLDDKMIAILLSAARPSRLDVNSLDAEYRTPMYVAATEGSLLDKGVDPSALGRCIRMLQRFGGRMTITGTPKVNRHPVSVLSSLLLPEYLSTTLGNLPFTYPLSSLDNYKMKPLGSSLSAIYHYPIHFAILAIRNALSGAIVEDEKLPEGRLIRCLHTLFERGFEPNERLECTNVSEVGSEEMLPFFGFAPIQLLAVVALELESLKEKIDSSVFEKKTAMIRDVATFLIRNGSRISLDPPPQVRQRKHSVRGGTDKIRKVDILPMKLDSDKQVLALFEVDREEGLSKARQEWTDSRKVESFINVDLLDKYTTLDDSDTPGGTDSQSCAICWVVFGTIMNRRHKCRVTGRFVCDDCSIKRLVVGGTEHRISDGQFLFFKGDSRQNMEPKEATVFVDVTQTRNSMSTNSSSVRQKIEMEENANRDSLFGTLMDRAASYVMGDVDDTPSKVSGLVSTLDQTRDALHQRGERLNTLSDKSAQLVDASADFAKMAKQLNKQSEGGFFW